MTATSYTLYYSPAAASMVVHLALLEIGAPYELRRLDFGAGEQRDPAYLALNPQGVVPTLIVDGKPKVESAALLMILSDRHPESGLAPAPGTPERHDWYQWLVYLSNNLGAAYRYWFYPADLGTVEHLPTVRQALQHRIESVWDRLESVLSVGGPYLLGSSFSSADLLLTMYMRWSRNMPRTALEWPSLKRLADRIRARPSWKRVYEIEGITDWL